ncbi:hypothetical protein NL676_006368, partial [Syzygium grande]
MGASTAQPPPSSAAALPSTADSVQLSPASQKRIGKLADMVQATLAKLGPTNGMPASHSRSSIEKRLSKLFPTFQTPDHPTYALMIRRAIEELNEEGGSSEESISKFIKEEYRDLPWGHPSLLSHHLKKLSECGEIISASMNHYTLPFGDNNFSVPGRRDKRDRSKQQGFVIQVTNPPKKALRSFRGTEGKDQSQHQRVQLNRPQELDVMKEGRIGVEANEVLHEAHMQECERIEVSENAREGIVQAIEEEKHECLQSRAVQLKEKHLQQREVHEESRAPEQENEVTENQAQLCEQHDKDRSQLVVHKDEAQKQIDAVVVEQNLRHQTQDNKAMEEEHSGQELDRKLVEQDKRNERRLEVIKEHDLQDQQNEFLGVELQMLEKEIAGMEELTNHPRQPIELADENVVVQETLIESSDRSTDVCTVQEQLQEKQGEILSIVVRPDPLPHTPTFEEVGPSHISKEKCIELLKRNKEIEDVPARRDSYSSEGTNIQYEEKVELSSSKRPPEVEAAVLHNQSLREKQPKLSDNDLPRSLEVEPEALTTNLTVDKSTGSGSITTGASFDVPLVDLGKFKKVRETEISDPKYRGEVFSQQKTPESQSDAAINAREDAQAYEQAQLLEPSYEGKPSQVRSPLEEAPALPDGPVGLEHGERSQTSYQLDGERQQELSVHGHVVVPEAAKFMPPGQTQLQNLGQQQPAKFQPWGQGFLNVKGNGASAFKMKSISIQSKQLSPERHEFSESQTSSVSAPAVGLPAAVHHEQVQNELRREKFLPRDFKLPPSKASALPLITGQENEANEKSRPIRCYGLELFDREAVAPFTFLRKSLQPEQQKPLQSEKMATTAKMLLLRHKQEQPCELKRTKNHSQQNEPKLQIEEPESNHQVSKMNLEILQEVVDIPQQPQHRKRRRNTKLQMLRQQSSSYKNKLRPRVSEPIQVDLGLDRLPADLLPLNHETAVKAVVQPQIVRQGQPQLKCRGRPPKTKQQGQPEIKRLGRPPKLRSDEDGVVGTSPLDQHHQQSCGPVLGRPHKRKAGDATFEGTLPSDATYEATLPSSEHAQKRHLGRPPKAQPVLHAGLFDLTEIDKSQRVELPSGASNGQVAGGERIEKPPELVCAPLQVQGEGELPVLAFPPITKRFWRSPPKRTTNQFRRRRAPYMGASTVQPPPSSTPAPPSLSQKRIGKLADEVLANLAMLGPTNGTPASHSRNSIEKRLSMLFPTFQTPYHHTYALHEIIEESRPTEQENEVTENQAQLREQHDKDHSQSTVIHNNEAQKQIDVVVVEQNPRHQTQDNKAMEEAHAREDLDGKLVEQDKGNKGQVEVIKEYNVQDQQYENLGVQLQMLEEEIAGMEELTNHLRQQIELADENVVVQETLIESRNSTDVCTVQEQLCAKQGEILSVVVRPDLLPSTPNFKEEKCIELLKRNKEFKGRLMAIFESWNAMESSTHMPWQNLLAGGKDDEALEGQTLRSDIGQIEFPSQMCQQEWIHTQVKAPIFNVKKQAELSTSKRPPEVEAAVLHTQSLRETQPKLSAHDLPRSLEIEPEALTTNITVDKSAGSGSIITGASFDVPLVDLGKFKKVQETEVSAPKYHAEIFSQQKPLESQSDAAIYAREDAQVYEQAQLEPSYEGKTSQVRSPFKEAPALPDGPVDLEHGERSQMSYQLDGERQQELSVQGHAVVLGAAKFMPLCQTQPQNLGQQQQEKLQPWGRGFLNVKGNGASAFRMISISPQSKQLSPERHKFSESQRSSVSASVVGLPTAVHHEQVQNELRQEELLLWDSKLPPSEASALPLINEQENEANKKSKLIKCFGLELFDCEAVAPFTFLRKSLQPEQQKRKRLLQQKPLQSEKMATMAKMLFLRHQHGQPCELNSIGNRLLQDEPKLQCEELESYHQMPKLNLAILHKAVDIPQQPQHRKSGRHTKRQMLQEQSLLYKNKLHPRASGPIQGDPGLDRVPADMSPLNHGTAANAVVPPQIVRQGQPQLKRCGRPPKTKQQGQPEIKHLGRPPKLRSDEHGVVRTSPFDQHHEQSCGPVQGSRRKRKAGDTMNEGTLPSCEHAQKRHLGRTPKAKPVLNRR